MYSEGQVSGWSIVVRCQVEGASPMSPWQISNMPRVGELMCGLTCLDRRDQRRRGNYKQGLTRKRNAKPASERRDLSSTPWGWSQSHETKQVKLTQLPEQAKQDCGPEGESGRGRRGSAHHSLQCGSSITGSLSFQKRPDCWFFV